MKILLLNNLVKLSPILKLNVGGKIVRNVLACVMSFLDAVASFFLAALDPRFLSGTHSLLVGPTEGDEKCERACL